MRDLKTSEMNYSGDYEEWVKKANRNYILSKENMERLDSQNKKAYNHMIKEYENEMKRAYGLIE
ncbi:hypothetical protein BELL_2472g00010 [Botrytis elliptica]|uniref:Uncharacterized protein n=1 Tax=Botrytis elliptica TaxID=278938 RepID=A0A4Z1H9A3_9HELO|nr:hypothetical protein BELL_2472g00010 [Botrytis elliptica]